MSSLPQLRHSLVSAAARQVEAPSLRRRRWRGPLLAAPGTRHRGPLIALRVLAGAGVVCALAAAGSDLLGPDANPGHLTSFECGTGQRGYHGDLVDPDPVAACASLWPSIFHTRAPALTAWLSDRGGVVYVLPDGAPPRGQGFTRLPAGRIADTAAIELNDQLQDATTGLQGRSCWSSAAATALVAATLRTDGLTSWRVQSRIDPSRDAHPNCVVASEPPPSIDADTKTVLVYLQHMQLPPGASTSPAGRVAGMRLTAVETRVNRGLRSGSGCATVAQAASAWRAGARTAGIAPASYHLDASPVAPADAHTCARIFVDVLGGGTVDVVAAAYP